MKQKIERKQKRCLFIQTYTFDVNVKGQNTEDSKQKSKWYTLITLYL